jgi:hypothetical protein
MADDDNGKGGQEPAGGGSADGDGAEGTEPAAPEPAAPADDKSSQEGGDEAPPQTFSQADVDRIVADRLKREREKFKDYPELKAKAAEHDKALEAQKTAEQRAQEEADKANKRAQSLLAGSVRNQIKALAAEKFADPEDPPGFLDVTRYASEDGEIDTDAIRADLDDLLARKPHLGKPDPKPRPPAPTRAQGSSGNGAQEANVTPGMGRLRHAYSSSNPK